MVILFSPQNFLGMKSASFGNSNAGSFLRVSTNKTFRNSFVTESRRCSTEFRSGLWDGFLQKNPPLHWIVILLNNPLLSLIIISQLISAGLYMMHQHRCRRNSPSLLHALIYCTFMPLVQFGWKTLCHHQIHPGNIWIHLKLKEFSRSCCSSANVTNMV